MNCHREKSFTFYVARVLVNFETEGKTLVDPEFIISARALFRTSSTQEDLGECLRLMFTQMEKEAASCTSCLAHWPRLFSEITGIMELKCLSCHVRSETKFSERLIELPLSESSLSVKVGQLFNLYGNTTVSNWNQCVCADKKQALQTVTSLKLSDFVILNVKRTQIKLNPVSSNKKNSCTVLRVRSNAQIILNECEVFADNQYRLIGVGCHSGMELIVDIIRLMYFSTVVGGSLTTVTASL
jgi:hypothetical protein